MAAQPPTPTPTPTPTPVKRRSWRRRLLGLGLVVVALLLLAPLLLALPPVRTLVADRIGATLDRRVEIGSSFAYWFHGIDLEDITIHSPDDFDGPLATIRKVHVDLDVLALLAGNIDASARILAPHVTFRRNARGAGNADGIPPTQEADEDTGTEARDLDLDVVVIAGRVESLGGAATDGAALRDIELAAVLGAGGTLSIDAAAVAEGAAAGGGNARIVVRAELDGEGAGPFRIAVPPLDLARLARLARDSLGVRELTGTLDVEGSGTLHPDRTVDGSMRASGDVIAAVTPGGVRVSLQRLRATAALKRDAGATDGTVVVRMGDVRVARVAGGRAEGFREPSITVTARALFHPEGRVVISQAKVEAGATLQAHVTDAFKVQTAPVLRFTGTVAARSDLGRLGALRALVPALAPLGGGSLAATIEGTGDRDLEVAAAIEIANLILRPSTLAPDGYRERAVKVSFRARHGQEAGSSLTLHKLESALVRATVPATEKPLALGVDGQERAWVRGAFELNVDLPSLSRLMGASLGLVRGEQIGGRVRIAATGSGGADAMRLNATVGAERVVFPASWGAMGSPATLTLTLAGRNQGRDTHVDVGGIRGMGLSGTAELRLRRGEEGTGLSSGEAKLGIALEEARPWLGGLLGLDPQARLSGTLRSALHIAGSAEARRVGATAQVNDLLLQARPGAPVINETRMVAQASVRLAPEGGRSVADELKLTTAALTLDASGSTYVAGPDPEIEASVRLSGNAERLAPMLAAFLGEEYEDLRGQGQIAGTLQARGSPADNARSLIADGTFHLGSWTTSGMQVTDLKATVDRPDTDAPFSAGVVAGLNGGKAFAQGTLRPGRTQSPWDVRANLTRVDTAGMLTSRGLGRYLALALPAMLPAGATAPVLSGLLDVELRARAGDLTDFANRPDFTGGGAVTMAQGEIKQSTLLGGRGDGTVAKLITALKVAVPEAGRVLEEISRSLTFSALESRFSFAGRLVTLEKVLLTGRRVVVDMRGTVRGDAHGAVHRLDLPTRLVLQGSAGKRLGKVLPGGAIPILIGGTLEDPKPVPQVDAKKLLGAALPSPKDLIERFKKGKPKLPKLPNPFK